MKIYGDISKESRITEQGTAMALGKFDGLHRGHRLLIDMVVRENINNLMPAVFTFARAPRELLEKSRQKYILTATEKRLFMEKSGIHILVEQPLIESILRMEPESFVKEILVERMNVKKIFCGTDFHFGHKRRGDVELLRQLESKYGYETIVVNKLKYGEREISSTYIKEEIEKGAIKLMNELLGYPYTVIGVVTKGKRLGRTLGFPTVNIIPEEDKLLPPNGVYFTNAIIDGNSYPAVTNVGIRPSVDGDAKVNIETHILDFSMDVYGKTLELQFLQFEREEMKFNSVEELKSAVHNDIVLRKGMNKAI